MQKVKEIGFMWAYFRTVRMQACKGTNKWNTYLLLFFYIFFQAHDQVGVNDVDDIAQMMNTWTQQIGYPVLTINTTDGAVSQKQFTLNPSTESGYVHSLLRDWNSVILALLLYSCVKSCCLFVFVIHPIHLVVYGPSQSEFGQR